jgi:AcrR family transcriptional regulator
MHQPIETKRRIATQRRALETVDTLFEAVARILETGKHEQLTTNGIAARAGYSIGTLYGYFPNKQALLRAIGLREVELQRAHLSALPRLTRMPKETVVRHFIRAALLPFSGRPLVRKAMMALLVRDEAIMSAPLSLFARWNKQTSPFDAATSNKMSEVGRFAMPRAVAGAVRAAVTERPDLLDSTEFENELVQLAMHFMRPRTRMSAQEAHLPG